MMCLAVSLTISFDDEALGSLDVKIPAGIAEGQSIRLKGKGRSSRDGKDVYITKNIPFTTVALGGEVNVDTLYGTVRCKVPAGSQPGSKLRLKNKGIVSMKNKNSYGDEYVIIQVDVPKNLTERERTLLQEFQEIHDKKTA